MTRRGRAIWRPGYAGGWNKRWSVGPPSSGSGGVKRVSVADVTKRCSRSGARGRYIIGRRAAREVPRIGGTWNWFTFTATDKSTQAGDREESPRPARGVGEGLSRMTGNRHVRFSGGGETAMSPCY